MWKKVILNFLILIGVLVISNYVYTKWFFEDDLKKNSDIIQIVRDLPRETEIVYVAESSNITYRMDDLDKRKISEFIGDYYPDIKVSDLTKAASHAGIYKVLLEQIPRESKVKTVVITLNLRSLNAQWIYSNLETALQKSVVLLKNNPPLVNRFLLSFKAYDIKTDKERQAQIISYWKSEKFKTQHLPYKNVIEWDRFMAQRGILDSSGKYDTVLTPLACSYIKTYAFELDTLNNPRIKDFDKIIKLAKKRGWNLVFNLLPENLEQTNRLVGKELVQMIEHNSTILKKYYTNKGVLVVDNLHLVKDDQFIDRDFPTEHYAEQGRKAIAEQVSNQLKCWYGSKYKTPVYTTKLKTTFLNTCENSEIWNQGQTITTEKSHSGTKSSLFYGENPYSITLEYPIGRLSDSLKNQVTISFWYFHSSDSEASLIIESIKINQYHNTNQYLYTDRKFKKGNWEFYSRTIVLEERMKKADVLKIFLYNPGGDKKYVDDFYVGFE
jgi:hypothetical protein